MERLSAGLLVSARLWASLAVSVGVPGRVSGHFWASHWASLHVSERLWASLSTFGRLSGRLWASLCALWASLGASRRCERLYGRLWKFLDISNRLPGRLWVFL